MSDIPIIFSAPMVRALLDGRKTMTRRLLYTKRKARNGMVPGNATVLLDHPPPRGPLSPKGFPTDIAVGEYWTLSPWQRVKPGDRLWARERAAHRTWTDKRGGAGEQIIYHSDLPLALNGDGQPLKWRPSIHMPRAWSRVTLTVTATKIERLQDICADDAWNEGVERRSRKVRQMWLFGQEAAEREAIYKRACVWEFEDLWKSLHGEESWADNPEVVALTFTVHKQNIDTLPKAEAA